MPICSPVSVAAGWPTQALPADERRSVDALLRQLDFHGDELAVVERDIAIEAIDDPVVARLMTVPGIDVIVAVSIVAAVGDFSRFDDPGSARRLSRVEPDAFASPATRRPSTGGSPRPVRPRPEGCSSRPRSPRRGHPDPLRAFYRRVKDRRGFQIATVATARKMTVLCWHLGHQRRGLRVRPPEPQRPQAAQSRTRRRVPPGVFQRGDRRRLQRSRLPSS